jgi:hypothetical protein
MEDVFRGNSSPELREVVWELASNASVHLEHARGLKSTVPLVRDPVHAPQLHAHRHSGGSLSALACGGSEFLARSLAEEQFRCVAIVHAHAHWRHPDPFDPRLHEKDAWLFARLYWAHIRAAY